MSESRYPAYQFWCCCRLCQRSQRQGCECLRRGISTSFYTDRRGRIKIRNTGKDESAAANRRRPSEDHQRITGRYDRDHCDRSCPTFQGRERQTIRSGTKWNYRDRDIAGTWSHRTCGKRISFYDAASREDDDQSCKTI